MAMVAVRYSATDTTLKVLVYSDTAGIPSITIEGTTWTGSVINDSTYRTGLVSCTGLQSNRRYTAQVSIDGVPATTINGQAFRPRTRAMSGEVRLAWASCVQMAWRDLPGAYQILNADVQALLTQGDWPYPANSATWGVTRDTQGWNDAQEYAKAHEQTMRIPSLAALSLQTEMLMMWDDHEPHLEYKDGAIVIPDLFDNWPSTFYCTVDVPAPPDLSVDPRVTEPWATAYNAGRLAMDAYTRHNPAPISSGRLDWISDFGMTIDGRPMLRVFTPDLISDRSFVTYNGAGKRMMTDAELANLLTALSAAQSSGIPFKLLNSTKKFWNCTSDNTDTFGNYTTQRNALLAGIKDRGITGMGIISGDRHAYDSAWDDTYGIPCMTACPIGVDNNPTQGADYPAGIRSKMNGPVGTTPAGVRENVWGMIRIPADGEYMELSTRLVSRGGKAAPNPIRILRNTQSINLYRAHA